MKEGREVGKREEMFRIAYMNPEGCGFHRIPGFIVAMANVDGGMCCAFFDEEVHTEESIKRNNEKIMLHSIYPCWQGGGAQDDKGR